MASATVQHRQNDRRSDAVPVLQSVADASTQGLNHLGNALGIDVSHPMHRLPAAQRYSLNSTAFTR